MFLLIYLFLKLQRCSIVIALASTEKPKGLRWVGQTIALKPILLATGLSLQRQTLMTAKAPRVHNN